MPLYDYRCTNHRCDSFDVEFERMTFMVDRHDQKCDTCGDPLEKLDRPTPRYKPFQNYFDLGLGVEVTGRDHHRRLLRDMNAVQRDPPSKGDISARKDWAAQARKESRNLTPGQRRQ